MGISPYPRSGHRIAPALLRAVLAVAVPCRLLPERDSNVSLCDLDESAWVRFGPQACHRLASAVVDRVRAELASGADYFFDAHLPKPPKQLVLEDLHLEVRTYNCLCNLRTQQRLLAADDWAGVTIWQLLGISAFGAKSLVDFLSSYETCIGFRSVQHEVSPNPGQLVVKQAKPPALGRENSTENSAILQAWCANPGSFVPHDILGVHLPKPPLGVTLKDLKLKNRTCSCLTRAGYKADLQSIGDVRVGEVLKIPGFGITSLVDLVTSLGTCLAPANVSKAVGEGATSRAEDEILREWAAQPSFPISRNVRACHLPRPPEGMRLEDLSLNERIYNCLEKHGFAKRPQGLGDCKIAEIVQIFGIGEKGLTELLHSLQRCGIRRAWRRPHRGQGGLG